jgi:hypothetical protein
LPPDRLLVGRAELELLDATPDETDGRHFVLAVHVRAAVKNSGRVRGQILRVGTQFVDLVPSEYAYLVSLARLTLIGRTYGAFYPASRRRARS